MTHLTASVQFHELAQGYRAATPDGAQAAYEKLCAFLEGRAAGEDRNSTDGLNGGMHDSIFVKVWGDAGGGDDGRRALAQYAYNIGFADRAKIMRNIDPQAAALANDAAPQPVDALHKDVEWLVESAEMARTNPELATQIRANCKAGSAPQPVAAAQAVPMGAGDPEAFFAQFCDIQGYPSDSDLAPVLNSAFYEGIRYCAVHTPVATLSPVAQSTDTTKGA